MLKINFWSYKTMKETHLIKLPAWRQISTLNISRLEVNSSKSECQCPAFLSEPNQDSKTRNTAGLVDLNGKNSVAIINY